MYCFEVFRIGDMYDVLIGVLNDDEKDIDHKENGKAAPAVEKHVARVTCCPEHTLEYVYHAVPITYAEQGGERLPEVRK